MLEARVTERFRGQHLRDVLSVRLTGEDRALALDYTVDREALDRLEREWFGRLVLMTDRHDGTTAEIIGARRRLRRQRRRALRGARRDPPRDARAPGRVRPDPRHAPTRNARPASRLPHRRPRNPDLVVGIYATPTATVGRSTA
ncbi:MAG: hypothetical protein Q8K82_13385 [Gemmatimonadaceae bacterium]|nr:hypothetical protein [Gemmatimonadaceae bacterium]